MGANRTSGVANPYAKTPRRRTDKVGRGWDSGEMRQRLRPGLRASNEEGFRDGGAPAADLRRTMLTPRVTEIKRGSAHGRYAGARSRTATGRRHMSLANYGIEMSSCRNAGRNRR